MSNFFVNLGSGFLPWYAIVIAAVCTYFLGNINPAILIGKAKGIDIRTQGSGNAGATNALRSLGKREGALTFAIDVVKGWVGFFVPLMIFSRIEWLDDSGLTGGTVSFFAVAMLCGLCVVLGHMFPAAFGFRGGKGVATTFGVLLAASWLYALVLLAIVLLFTLIFKRVSLSVIIAVLAGIIFLIFDVFHSVSYSWDLLDPLWVIIIFALIVLKHSSNIKRLIKGEEPKLDLSFLKRGKRRERQ